MIPENLLWTPWRRLAFLPVEIWEYPVLAVYVLAIIALLVHSRRGFVRVGRRRLVMFLLLLLVPLFLGNLFVLPVSRPDLLPPPNLPLEPPAPFVPLLGAVPIAVAGAWLGAGPALAVGLLTGVVRAFTTPSGVLDPFYFAFYGFLVGLFLRQVYWGRLPFIVRQPLVALPLATVLASPLQLVSAFAHTFASGLAGLDYAVTMLEASIGPMLVQSLVAALVVQAAYLLFPRVRPARAAQGFPPYSRTLGRQQLLLFVPLMLLMMSLFVYTVVKTTLRVATEAVLAEMARDASSAAEDIPYFISTGQGLLTEFATDDRLWSGEPVTLARQLRGDVRMVPFFDQLTLYGVDGARLAMYPSPPAGDPGLTEPEAALLQRVLDSGAVQISGVHRSKRGEVILSFLAAVGQAEDDEAIIPKGVLIGRTRMDTNPVLGQLLANLQWTRAEGAGFVVDSLGRVVVHSDLEMLLSEWLVDGGTGRRIDGPLAYESRDAKDNTRQMVYYLPVEGYPSWAIVMLLPHRVVLEYATRIATPLLLVQVLLGSAVVIFVPLATAWLTRPLKRLAGAADRIAEGDLTASVRVPGNDEVARVGEAFEGMRVRLKDRLDGLSLLLEVGQAASVTLDLSKELPVVLERVLQASGARVARIVLLSVNGTPLSVIGHGASQGGLGGLDRALAMAARDVESPLIVEDVARAGIPVDLDIPDGPIKAAVVLPVRSEGEVSAVMWVGYGEVREFDPSELALLSTLASHTAVLVENARLFQSAEEGRRRLAAILASTIDAVVVTDRNDLIVLINPAAEQALGITGDTAAGKRVDRVEWEPALATLFAQHLPPEGALNKEVSLSDGRTLYASVSAILSAGGERIGRVSMMRDISHFKELDEMKSELVATVSRDLRAPLTFLRGYAMMLPMVGEVNEKQRDHLDKILQGVDQMGKLIDDLLNLERIEAGIGLERRPCHLGAILVEAVDSARAQVSVKGLTLNLEPAEKVAVVTADAALLRQAITNLVDNAIKYTPSGGIVRVGLSVSETEAVIRVADTGIGIAASDQARLFEKFYRIKRRDSTDVPRTGLGLAVVRSAVEYHGGRVWVESELGKGSTFFISLPLSGPESQAQATLQ